MDLVTKEMVNNIIINSEIVCQTQLGRITIVTLVAPSGFTITESSASSTVDNYDYQYGIGVCMKKIEDEIFKLEAYRLLAENYQRKMIEEYKKQSKTQNPEENIETITEEQGE